MIMGKGRMINGTIMVALQLVVDINSSTSFYISLALPFRMLLSQVAGWIAYHLGGLIGAGLIVWGVFAYIRSKHGTDNDDDCYEYYKSLRNDDDIYKK